MSKIKLAKLSLVSSLLLLSGILGCAQRSMAPPPDGARTSGTRWRAEFPRPWQPGERASVGAYREGSTVVNFESLSPLLIEPPPTGAWNVETAASRRGTVVFRDDRPGLVPNPDGEGQPFYRRAEGAITALAWVDQEYSDVRVSVRVNTSGGRDGRGATSRQGPMLRWDKGSNYLWCAVNFAAGTVSIVRAQHFGIMKDIEGSERRIDGFTSTKAYDVVFDAVGNRLQCQVLEDGRAVARTVVTAAPPAIRGVAGVLFEVALQKTFEPLEGSFDAMTAVGLER